jgi:AcrR family transcriptional regulator
VEAIGVAVDVRPESPRRARTRERLLDAAFEVFAEHGLGAASVEQIAERAGFTRGAFYSNFSTKEELFLALMARDHERWIEDLNQRVEELLPEGTATPITEDEIGAMVTAVLAGPFEHRHWCLIQNEFLLQALRDPELALAYAADRAMFEQSLVPTVEMAVRRAGRRLTLDTLTTVQVAMSLYQEVLESSVLSGRSENESVGAVQRALTRVLDAVTEPI